MTTTLLLGLGNPLMGDDGIGLEALRRLTHAYALPADINPVDGGTWGMNLLPLIESHRRVVLLDAIDAGARPGSLVMLSRSALPAYLQHKLSPHQIDLREVLAVAELRGTLPPTLVALGIQPETVDMGYGLSSAAELAMPAFLEMVLHELESLGHERPRRRALRSEPELASA